MADGVPKLTEPATPATPARVAEFVAWHRGRVEAADDEQIRPFLGREALRWAYVRDMSRVLDALELVARAGAPEGGVKRLIRDSEELGLYEAEGGA
jgi:hypothetical protein